MLKVVPCTKAAFSLVVLIALAGYAYAAVNRGAAANQPVHFYSLVYTNPASGQEMYMQYCAGCHGMNGKGKTKTAGYCTVGPADLTQLTRKNYGTFPVRQVSAILHAGTGKPYPGPGYMPVWQTLLESLNGETPDITELRITNLIQFLKTLQDTPATPHLGRVAP